MKQASTEFDLQRCARCKRMFFRLGTSVCYECQPDEDADFEKIRDVLDRHEGLAAEELAEMAGVAAQCVLRMIEEGRLANEDASNPIRCGRCGEPAISMTKRLCYHCLSELDRLCTEALRTFRQRDKGSAHEIRETVDNKREERKGEPKQAPGMSGSMNYIERLKGRGSRRGR